MTALMYPEYAERRRYQMSFLVNKALNEKLEAKSL